MKKFKLLIIAFAALTLSMNNIAFSKNATDDFKVAAVDIPQVIENSNEIKAILKDRQNKLNDLQAFVEKARADVAKESNENKKASLEENYNKQLNEKKNALDKDYSKKLADADKNITELINKKAHAMGYNLILTKSTVLGGAVDITPEIIKELKNKK